MAGSVMGEISRFAEDKETGGIIMSRPILLAPLHLMRVCREKKK